MAAMGRSPPDMEEAAPLNRQGPDGMEPRAGRGLPWRPVLAVALLAVGGCVLVAGAASPRALLRGRYESTVGRSWGLSAKFWTDLGVDGGGTVEGTFYTEKDCYEWALESNEGYARAWSHLGKVGGGTIRGAFYTEKDCYERALGSDDGDASAWCNLGQVGGGTVLGRFYAKKDCYERALESDDGYSKAWSNLGQVGGGTVGGRFYSSDSCFVRAQQSAIGLQLDTSDAYLELLHRASTSTGIITALSNYVHKTSDRSDLISALLKDVSAPKDPQVQSTIQGLILIADSLICKGKAEVKFSDYYGAMCAVHKQANPPGMQSSARRLLELSSTQRAKYEQDAKKFCARADDDRH